MCVCVCFHIIKEVICEVDQQAGDTVESILQCKFKDLQNYHPRKSQCCSSCQKKIGEEGARTRYGFVWADILKAKFRVLQIRDHK